MWEMTIEPGRTPRNASATCREVSVAPTSPLTSKTDDLLAEVTQFTGGNQRCHSRSLITNVAMKTVIT
jgi:hypothetical protein